MAKILVKMIVNSSAHMYFSQMFLLQAKNLKQMPLVLFGILTMIGGILSVFLPETHNKPLPDSIEDVEKNQS